MTRKFLGFCSTDQKSSDSIRSAIFSLLTIGEITVNEKVQQTSLQISIYENLRFLIEGMSSYMLLYTAFMGMKHISMHVTQKNVSYSIYL